MTDAPRAPSARHLLSIVTPVYDPPREAFDACVRVRPGPGLRPLGVVPRRRPLDGRVGVAALCRSWRRTRPRIKVTRRDANGGISAATQRCAWSWRPATSSCCSTTTTQLTPDALGAVNHELWLDPTVDYVYSRRGQDRRRRLAASTASTSRTGRPSGCSARTTAATSRRIRRSIADRRRRLPLGVRRRPGLRRRAARHRAGPQDRPHPARSCTTGGSSRARRRRASTPSRTPSPPASAPSPTRSHRRGIAGRGRRRRPRLPPRPATS